MSARLIVISNETWSLLSLRGELLKILIRHNLSITTLSNSLSKEQALELKSIGASCEEVCLSRNGLNLLNDIRYFFNLILQYRFKRPDIILAYTIKPVIWGGIASRFFKVNFYALITGLGFAFHGKSLKRRLLTKLIIFLYRAALKNSKAVIFQNIDDRNVFIEKGIVPKSKTHVVNGSGVDIIKFNVEAFPKGEINFLCIARLLNEKGLREYAAAARIVKDKFPDVGFNLVGLEDSSPDAILLEEVYEWADYLDYKNSTHDVRSYIKDCHVYVLPSYHEGLPRSTLEAMSMGRPILTTDTAGCKETVENGSNGFKVPVGSVDKLVEKMIWYVKHTDQIKKMGLESRKMVEDKFDMHKINKEMLRIMGIE